MSPSECLTLELVEGPRIVAVEHASPTLVACPVGSPGSRLPFPHGFEVSHVGGDRRAGRTGGAGRRAGHRQGHGDGVYPHHAPRTSPAGAARRSASTPPPPVPC